MTDVGLTIWWMLPPRGIASAISKIALIVYMPLYIALDAVLGIGSGILIGYRNGLAAADRAGVDGALVALFFGEWPIDWIDTGASLGWAIGAIAAALALWQRYGWRVSVPLAASGWLLGNGHYPPEDMLAGLTLGIAVWQYLILERRVGPSADRSASDHGAHDYVAASGACAQLKVHGIPN